MREVTTTGDPASLRVGVAVADFNAFVTDGLLAGALESLEERGVADITVIRVPGAMELPVGCVGLVQTGCTAVVALGAVILGETDHYTHVAAQASAGLRQVAVQTGVPIGFGLLTCREAAQARERSLPGPGNKGAEAAGAAVDTALLLAQLGK